VSDDSSASARVPRAPARIALRVAAATAAFLAAVFAATFVHRVLDITRGAPVAAVRVTPSAGPPAIREGRFTTVIEAHGRFALADGHAVELLTDGPDLFARMFDDLRGATRSITLQAYYCGPGAVADSVAAIVAERARAGVRVRVVADGFGCRSLARHYGTALRAAGVELAVLRPVRWYSMHRAQHRSHVRLIVVDGAIAYTGGFGIDDKWLTADGVGWRDYDVRFSGPAVAAAQGAFAVAWAEATGELLAGPGLLPDPALIPHDGGARAAIQFDGPGIGSSGFERTLLLTIAGARERLYIASGYFVPGAPVRAALVDAARRGVDVRVLTAGRRTDVPTTLLAARARYDELLAGGVRIYEYQPTMMHAKAWVADGAWVGVGSMNIDNRSMRLNDELILLIQDDVVGAALETRFHDDLGRSTEIELATHRARPLRQRALERAVRWVAPLL
jgi:cardiolipin synthase A/B